MVLNLLTEPVDPVTAVDPASYTIGTYTYIFQGRYGSPQVDATQPTIKSAKVASDGKSVRLAVDGLQIGHVHELKMAGIKSKATVILYSTTSPTTPFGTYQRTKFWALKTASWQY